MIGDIENQLQSFKGLDFQTFWEDARGTLRQFLPENGPGPKEGGDGDDKQNPFTKEMFDGLENFYDGSTNNFNRDQAL
jgi:hypothetical protein